MRRGSLRTDEDEATVVGEELLERGNARPHNRNVEHTVSVKHDGLDEEETYRVSKGNLILKVGINLSHNRTVVFRDLDDEYLREEHLQPSGWHYGAI